MINLVTKAFAAIFGTKAERDLKELTPYVGKINAAWEQLQGISDDDLRNATDALRLEINTYLKDIDEKIAAIHEAVNSNKTISIGDKEKAFAEIDKLEKERNIKLEEVLLKVLPTAFAVVKETARRFAQNGKLTVTTRDYDIEFAKTKPHVQVNGNTTVWLNKWLVAGHEITWDMVHYDVQLIGGVVLHQGKIAEMATGEGKTLVATLPAFLNALSGRGVHLVTVNDYLAKRDAEWNGPLFEFHGLKVDCIDKHEPNSPARRKAYMADIVYGTNNEYGFDYLRDNMARDVEDLVQRRLHFAMVDEVDSVLIDDARTPLIISGPMAQGDRQEFESLKPRVSRLVEAQKQLALQYLNEAKKLIAAGNEKEGGLQLYRAHKAMPKSKPLIKYLSETGIKAILQKTENYYLEDNQRRMPEADAPLYFTIDEKNNSIDLTEKGIDFITAEGEDPHFFILPDIGTALDAIEKDKSKSDAQKVADKNALIQEYTEKAKRIHTVQQLLKAYTLFEKEIEYIIVDGKVKIVDEQTGRVLEGRRYSDGLHQAIEAKENVKIEDATQTYATITLQNYFRMYHKLAGMTGTAETEAGEFWSIYKLDVVCIPTNKKVIRVDEEDKVYKTMREKYNAVVEEIEALVAKNRPVLVGTTSVETSELLSRMLKLRNIRHQVLNAKYHQKEAEIVAEAGKSGTVTIATNMAGRGTDIKLTPESKAAGGLAIIGTERHESRRVDRQLRGRAGRQGDPGSSQFFVSLEDNLMRLFGSERIIKLMDRMGLKEGEVIQHSMITSSIERAQKKVEENNFGIRKRLLEYDDVMNSQREVVYKRRRNALFGERLELDILTTIAESCDNVIESYKGEGNFEDFQIRCQQLFGFLPDITQAELSSLKHEELATKLYVQVVNYYRERNNKIKELAMPVLRQVYAEQGDRIENIVVPINDGKFHIQVIAPLKKVIETDGNELIKCIQKTVSLVFIDEGWKEHLRDMDDLKQSVQNASYEQKDPLLIYKFEALELFKNFIFKVNEDIVTFLFRAMLPVDEAPRQMATAPARQAPKPKLQENKPELNASGTAYKEGPQERATIKQEPIKAEKIANRNDRVTVRYFNGEVKKDVKYKTVEDDIMANRCVIVDV
jgi:preprotein translocase subunit SecA